MRASEITYIQINPLVLELRITKPNTSGFIFENTRGKKIRR